MTAHAQYVPANRNSLQQKIKIWNDKKNKENDSTCTATGQQKMRERREARLRTACCSASLAVTV